jgi:hypothetical protein
VFFNLIQAWKNSFRISTNSARASTYKLHAIAFNKANVQVDLGTKIITVDNAHAAKPFGTIDTPGQGDTIFGADYVNFGWALTPRPAMIPADGSTMAVIIDGVVIGPEMFSVLFLRALPPGGHAAKLFMLSQSHFGPGTQMYANPGATCSQRFDFSFCDADSCYRGDLLMPVN